MVEDEGGGESFCFLFFFFFFAKRNTLHSWILCRVINKTKHTAFLPKHMALFLKHRSGLPWNSVFVSTLFFLFPWDLLQVGVINGGQGWNSSLIHLLFPFLSPSTPAVFYTYSFKPVHASQGAVPSFKCFCLWPHGCGFTILPEVSRLCGHVVVLSPKYSDLSSSLPWDNVELSLERYWFFLPFQASFEELVENVILWGTVETWPKTRIVRALVHCFFRDEELRTWIVRGVRGWVP